MAKRIEIKMNWETAVKNMLFVFDNASPDGKRVAKEELLRAGRIADFGIDAIKLLREILDELKADQETGYKDGIYDSETTPTIQKIESLLGRVNEEAIRNAAELQKIK